MKQKSGPGKAPAEQVLKDIRRQTRRHIRRKRRSVSCWKDCGARRISPSSAGARALPPQCTMAGPRSSSKSVNVVSRYIVAWRLGPTMAASDVTATLDQALLASELDRVTHRPRLLSDNGSSYVADDLARWLEKKGMQHVRGAPYHPQTQGKIERWHQTLKNRILLDNYYLPGDLERQVRAFVEHYNHVRYHESIDNLTPADVYFGRAEAILAERKRIKRNTIANRRLQHQLQAT